MKSILLYFLGLFILILAAMGLRYFNSRKQRTPTKASKATPNMKLLGFWREYTGFSNDPSVYEETFNAEAFGSKDIIDPQIVSYLKLNDDKEGLLGGAIMVSRGLRHGCLIIPGMSYSYGFSTDGEYIWTVVLGEYYNLKAINLPKKFLEKMESLNYIVPEITDEQFDLFQETIRSHFYPNRWDNPFGLQDD